MGHTVTTDFTMRYFLCFVLLLLICVFSWGDVIRVKVGYEGMGI